MNNDFNFRIIGNNAEDNIIGNELVYDMKSAIKKASQMCFDQEVCAANSIITVQILHLNSDYDPVGIAGIFTFDAYQCPDGRIKYYMIITDAHNINHDYRGNF